MINESAKRKPIQFSSNRSLPGLATQRGNFRRVGPESLYDGFVYEVQRSFFNEWHVRSLSVQSTAATIETSKQTINYSDLRCPRQKPALAGCVDAVKTDKIYA
jgi:hypothetical protein